MFINTMLQLRQRKADPADDVDHDYDPYYPASMNSSMETRPMHQGLLRWSTSEDYSYDTLQQQQPPRRTFDLHSRSGKYQHRESASGPSLSLEMIQLCPSTPSPICSPFNDKIYNTTASASPSASAATPLSFSLSFLSSREFFAQSEVHSRGEKIERPGGFCRRENDGMQSTLYDSRKPTSSVLINPKKSLARMPMSFKDEVRPKPSRHQGFSVRRANLPRGYSCSDPRLILWKESYDPVPELSDINVGQPDPGKNRDSDANSNHASKKTAKNPKTSSERFEPLTPVQKGEEKINKKGTAIESSSGTNGSSSTGTNGRVQVCGEIVEKRSRSGTNTKRDEIGAKTMALHGAIAARVLNWLKGEEDIILWRKKQKAKAKAKSDKQMKDFERQLEKKREKEFWKTEKKIARTRMKTESEKSSERENILTENYRAASLGNKIRSVRMLPWKCISV